MYQRIAGVSAPRFRVTGAPPYRERRVLGHPQADENTYVPRVYVPPKPAAPKPPRIISSAVIGVRKMCSQETLDRLQAMVTDMDVSDIVKVLATEFNVDGLNHIMDLLEDFIQTGDV